MHVSNESQKPVILGQLEASDKRIQLLNLQIESYTKAIQRLPEETDGEVCCSSSGFYTFMADTFDKKVIVLDSATKETIANLKKELERQMEVEYRKKDALHRMDATQQSRKSSKAMSGYADDLQAIDRAVNKLTGEI